MARATQISIPTLVRVKAGALDRLGVYLQRGGHRRTVVFGSAGLVESLIERVHRALREQQIELLDWISIRDNDLESTARLFVNMPSETSAVVGVGGGKALDVAKYVAFLAGVPYCAVPTSLSNDGFCSPQSSLTVQSRRRSLRAALPRGVVVDTAVCQAAPRVLTLSGIGDLVAKFTATQDWKLAFAATGEPLDDFATLLSDQSVHAFLSRPSIDLEGIRLLATGLMLNGIAMEVAGTSRPASGSEHLISHALDASSRRPRLHGLQVGVASYLVSLVQRQRSQEIATLFEVTGFWDAIRDDPFDRDEWESAIRSAPGIKPGYYTILSVPERQAEAIRMLSDDHHLAKCFGALQPASVTRPANSEILLQTGHP